MVVAIVGVFACKFADSLLDGSGNWKSPRTARLRPLFTAEDEVIAIVVE
jgi:hypothetical protein